jgi:hypothetical protein
MRISGALVGIGVPAENVGNINIVVQKCVVAHACNSIQMSMHATQSEDIVDVVNTYLDRNG